MDPTTRRLPADERKGITVEAVIALAGSQDPSTITTAAIAQHMKLTQGALFRHFPTKDALWQSVMEWVAEHLLDRIDHAAKGSDSPLAALQAMFICHVEFVAEHPGVPRLMFGELQRAEESAARKAARSLIQAYGRRVRDRIDAGKACGEVAEQTDTDAAATLFVGTIQGLVMHSMLSGDIQRIRGDAPRVYALYERGIRSQA